MGKHGCCGYGATDLSGRDIDTKAFRRGQQLPILEELEGYENLNIGIGRIDKNPDAARGHTFINTTCVYSTKLKDGNTVFKARLTARGDQEDPDNINNDHQASPTADQDFIRLILAELANMPGAKLISFDFVRA